MQPHFGNTVVHAGAAIDGAPAAMILLHGRNAGPANILDLFARIDRPRVAALAPEASDRAWYPFNFLVPREQNEPNITSALFVIETLVKDLVARGIPSEKIVLAGFSQGACLCSEFALRHPRRYGGVMALSGGLIGPPGTSWDDVHASLDGTPIFLGCSDVDAYIPVTRVDETAAVFTRLGADVTKRIYPGMGHLVNDDEIEFVRGVIDALDVR